MLRGLTSVKYLEECLALSKDMFLNIIIITITRSGGIDTYHTMKTATAIWKLGILYSWEGWGVGWRCRFVSIPSSICKE